MLEHGLAAALDALATPLDRPRRRCRYEPDGRLPEPVELAAYFVASEALANVAEVRAARRSATVRVWRAGRARARSRSPTTASAAPTTRAAAGLRGLADRVEALDGRLRVVSPPGGGTIVSAELPCGS